MAALSIRFTVRPNIRAVEKKFRPKFRSRINRSLKKMATVIKNNIKAEAPKKTGDLRKAIVTSTRKVYIHEVKIDQRRKGARYEPAVRLGTRPHGIPPKTKKALWWPGLSHPVRWVGPPYTAIHPGTKPNDYWQRGIDSSKGDIEAVEKEIETEIIRSIDL